MKTATAMNWPTALLMVLPLAGCGIQDFAPRMVAGHIGCMPDDISITDVDSGLGGAAFLATCFNETYICSMDGHCTLLRDGPMGDVAASSAGPPCGAPVAVRSRSDTPVTEDSKNRSAVAVSGGKSADAEASLSTPVQDSPAAQDSAGSDK